MEHEKRWSPKREILRRVMWYRERLHAGGFRAAEAMDVLELHERTFHRDMAYLRTLRWDDLRFCRRERKWVLPDGQAPLPVVRLAEGEALALLVAGEALRSYAGTPYAATIRQALEKLSDLLEAPVTLDLASAALPHFTGPPARRVDPAQYDLLFRACQERRRLEMEYFTADRSEVNTRRIDPYHLLDHAGDWYVAAFDHRRGEVRTFALGDRMRDLRDTGERFEPDPAWSIGEYMAEGFGLHRGGPVEEVVLRFAPSAAPYLAEKAWAVGEVKTAEPDGGLVLRMTVPVNTGLLRFVLQWGRECEVVEPALLRDLVVAHLEQAVANYRRTGVELGTAPANETVTENPTPPGHESAQLSGGNR